MYFIFLLPSLGTEGIKVAVSFPTWTTSQEKYGKVYHKNLAARGSRVA